MISIYYTLGVVPAMISVEVGRILATGGVVAVLWMGQYLALMPPKVEWLVALGCLAGSWMCPGQY